jgi:hypothetical protein
VGNSGFGLYGGVEACGHSKTYGTKPYQCVKCGGQHDSKDCTKPRHHPAKCALCGENHPANYKGCSVYKNLVATRSTQPRVANLYQQHPASYPSPQRPTTTPPTSTTQPPPHLNSFHTNIPVQRGQYTYAQIMKNNQTSVLEQPPLAEHLAAFLNEFKTISVN